MKPGRSAISFIAATTISLVSVEVSLADALVTFQAESGALGSNFTNGTDGAIQYISISTDTVNSGNPGNANRVATYTVIFPEAGTYNLFARVRVGAVREAGAQRAGFRLEGHQGVRQRNLHTHQRNGRCGDGDDYRAAWFHFSFEFSGYGDVIR